MNFGFLLDVYLETVKGFTDSFLLLIGVSSDVVSGSYSSALTFLNCVGASFYSYRKQLMTNRYYCLNRSMYNVTVNFVTM